MASWICDEGGLHWTGDPCDCPPDDDDDDYEEEVS